MKRIFLSALIGIGIVAAIFQVSSVSAAQQHVFPLVCRGGGSITPSTVRIIGLTFIGFTFTRGKKPAGEGLAPGECSWEDRAINDDEPNTVAQREEVVGTPETRWYEELHSPDKYWTFMVSNKGGQLIANDARPNASGKIDVSATAKVLPDIEVIKSYPLICRGGESLVMKLEPAARSISLEFTKGTKPAGEGLARGECSWVDRAMNADEPYRLSQSVADGWESLEAEGTLPPENRWYGELHSPDKYWTFMVYRIGRRQFTVASARPKK